MPLNADLLRELELSAYQQGADALLGLIRGEQVGARTAADRRRRAAAKLARARAILAAFGNPQERYPTIHVTGTSGKGSTAAAIAAIVSAAGYRVGLRTSPYLQVPTEKLQIGDSLISGGDFGRLAADVVDRGKLLFPAEHSRNRLGYAEAWSALSFLWFAENQVDLAIIEVGAGGRFDSTNVISPLVSVITSVGLDHVVSLGPTLADIAWHKAGIIKPGATVVVGDLPPAVAPVITAEAALAGAPVLQADSETLPGGWTPAMPGQFQRANARLALTAVQPLVERGFTIPTEAARLGLCTARLPGRLECMPGGAPAVWIDGAHNEDKIAALAEEASRLTPNGRLPVVVLGLLGAKDAAAIARRLAPVASALVTTEPTVRGKRSRDSAQLAAELRAAGFLGVLEVVPEPDIAVRRAEWLAAEQGASVLVTGSMYLAGEVRRRWYPDDAVVLAQTSWPAAWPPVPSGVAGALGRLEGQETDSQGDDASDEEILASINEEPVRL